MRMKRILITMLTAVSATTLNAQSIYPGVASELRKVADCVTMKAVAFNMSDVKLLPSRFLDNMRRDSAWIVSLPAKELMHSFQTTAGVFSDREGGYMTVRKLGGWESLDCDLRGHSTGHLLSACAFMFAETGNSLFKAKGDSLVSMLAEVQMAFGNGYVSAFPEELINRNIQGKSVWAPWYTLHKLLAGLIDQYVYSRNEQALTVAVKFSDWAYNKLKSLDETTRQRMLRNEFGGMNEAFYNLYALTANQQCLWLARFFYHNEVIDPVKQHNSDFGTKHTNTFIPKILGEARNYELTGSAESRDAALFFWQQMTAHHCFATGELSDKEHFFDPTKQSEHLSGYTGETCCTYNLLKLCRHLFCWTADARIADYYERALYNHILGQQDPQSGMVCYFLPLLSGSHKVYSTPRNSFWCCVGSGFESHAKYAESIYYHDADGLFVNLFIPSVLSWKERGMTLTQRTSFPASDTIELRMALDSPQNIAVRLRCPSWTTKAEIWVNGKKQRLKAVPGSYIVLQRTWHNGDVVTAHFPMRLRLAPTNDNPKKAAVMFGPIVLAGEKGIEGMAKPAPMSNPMVYNDYYSYDYRVPTNLKTTLSLDRNHLDRSLKRVPNTLHFTSTDSESLLPLYDIHRQRYVVYWDLE